MSKRVVGTDVNCVMCSNRGPASSFFILQKQEEDDPETGDEDAPIPPLKIYMCETCYKSRAKEEFSGTKITMPFKDKPADKLKSLPSRWICSKCGGPKSTDVCARCDNPTPLGTRVKGPKKGAKEEPAPPMKGGLFA